MTWIEICSTVGALKGDNSRGTIRAMASISAAHERLGLALRRARLSAGLSTRQVPKNDPAQPYFSSGHISLVERGCTVPSPELVETYIKLSGQAAELTFLYEQMSAASQIAARRRRQRDSTEFMLEPPQRIAEVQGREDVQRHYLVEENEAAYLFGPTGAIQQVRCRVTLRAKAPGVRLYYAGYSYPADQRRGVLRVDAAGGAIISAVRESDNGVIQSYFCLDRAISPEDPDPYVISFRVLVNSRVQSAPHLRFHAEAGNRRLVLHSQFQSPALPQRLWEVEAPSVLDAAHPRSGNVMDCSATAAYSRAFDHLVPGWCYGLGWTW